MCLNKFFKSWYVSNNLKITKSSGIKLFDQGQSKPFEKSLSKS